MVRAMRRLTWGWKADGRQQAAAGGRTHFSATDADAALSWTRQEEARIGHGCCAYLFLTAIEIEHVMRVRIEEISIGDPNSS